jgi:hypothetical protein
LEQLKTKTSTAASGTALLLKELGAHYSRSGLKWELGSCPKKEN